MDPPSAIPPGEGQRASRLVSALFIASLGIFALVLFRRAWLSDDTFITFRTIDNFLNGYGLVWNVGERVQAYTHPLWMFILSGASLATGELVFTTLLLSIVISLAAVLLLATKIACSRLTAIFLVVVIALSNAFIDYSTSGLENPLSHLLLVIFFILFFSLPPSARKVFWLSFIASLGAVNRLDLLLIFGPALLCALYQTISSKTDFAKAILALIVGQAPLIAWEIFSVIYYGFPFPNTAYAKLNTGIPSFELFQQGWLYLRESLRTDPLTLVIIASGLILAFLGREKKNIPIALGIILYLVYILKIGGDFMSGRFLAAPFLCSLIILARFDLSNLPRLLTGILFAAVVAIGLLSATPTLNFIELDLTPEQRNAMVINQKIANERRYYSWSNGLFRIDPQTGIPAHPFALDGLETRQRSPKLARRITVGMFGYYAGPNVYVVDELALADALLARLPARRVDQWRIGHFQRTLPAGYLDTLRAGSNQLLDSKLYQLYDKLSLVTREGIWAPGRFRAIWQLNTGLAKALVDFDAYRYPKLTIVDPAVLKSWAELSRNIPAGTAWDAPGNLVFDESGIEVKMGELSHSSKLSLSLDGSNAYQIVFLRDGREIAVQEVAKASKKSEMTQLCLTVKPKAVQGGFDTIRIFSIQGDPDYSLGFLILGECQ